jgi:tetratricopeptide (TPR) repeat protein
MEAQESSMRRLAMLGLLGLCLTAAARAGRDDHLGVRPASKVSPEVSETLKTADHLFQGGDWMGAQLLYGRVLERDPNQNRALWRRGEALLKLGRDFEALGLVRHALGNSPTLDEWLAAARLWNEAATLDARFDRPARAREFTGQALASVPSSREGQIAVGPERLAELARLARTHGFQSQAGALEKILESEFPYHAFVAQATVVKALAGAVNTRQASVVAQGKASGNLDHMVWDRVVWLLVCLSFLGLAWGTGLLLLFLAGKGMSALVVRDINRQPRNDPAAIPRRQRLLRRAYRVIIVWAMVYYFISLAVLVVLSLGIPGGIFLGLVLTPMVPGAAMWAALPLVLVLLTLSVPLVRSLRVRLVDQAPGRPLAREEAPRLWELAGEVADRVGTRPVDEIRLTGGLSIAVVERGRWRDKLRGRSRRSLCLGMGTFEAFELGAFRAVLAHEYGHFHHGDTAGGEFVQRVNASLWMFAQSIIDWKGNAWWNVAWHFVRGYHALFNRITLGASRLQELHADRLSALSYGQAAASEGLLHMVRREAVLQIESQRAFEQAQHSRSFPRSPLRLDPVLDRRQAADWVATVLKMPAKEDHSHPSLSQRLAWIQASARGNESSKPKCEPDEGPLRAFPRKSEAGIWQLFADSERARGEYRRRCDAELQGRLDGVAAYQDAVISHCNVQIADHPELAAPFAQRAWAYYELGDYRSSVSDLTEAIARNGRDPMLFFNRAIAWTRLGDEQAALEDLQKASRLSPGSSEPSVWSALGDLYVRAGDWKQALTAYSKALDLNGELVDPLLKRAVLRAQQGKPGSAIPDFTRVIELDDKSAEAYLGRARAHRELQQLELARADAKQAMSLDPDLDEARAFLDQLGVVDQGHTIKVSTVDEAVMYLT